VLDKPAMACEAFDSKTPDPATAAVPYRIFNIGNGQPTPLMDYISAIEIALGVEAEKNFLPMQPGDVPSTAADMRELAAWIGFRPNTPVTEGVANFVQWYRNFYNV
jgi:UDP-glucuronate 4-epimerase